MNDKNFDVKPFNECTKDEIYKYIDLHKQGHIDLTQHWNIHDNIHNDEDDCSRMVFDMDTSKKAIIIYELYFKGEESPNPVFIGVKPRTVTV